MSAQTERGEAGGKPSGSGKGGRGEWRQIGIRKKIETWTTESSGITEHCNRLASHHACSAQVALAADFLHVSLPTTAHGNKVLQHTANPRRSSGSGLGKKKGREITALSFPEASY